MEAGPGFLVNLRLEGAFQRLVGIARGAAEEIGLAHEEALLVVIVIDEPAGDVLLGVGTRLHVAGGGVEDVDALDLELDHVAVEMLELDVRLAEDDEEIAGAGVLELVAHADVLVHPRLEHC